MSRSVVAFARCAGLVAGLSPLLSACGDGVGRPLERLDEPNRALAGFGGTVSGTAGSGVVAGFGGMASGAAGVAGSGAGGTGASLGWSGSSGDFPDDRPFAGR